MPVIDEEFALTAPQQPEALTPDTLDSSRGVAILGIIAAQMLKNNQIPAFMITSKGTIEVFPVEELILDALSVESAIDELMNNRGYTDGQIESYLRQRDDRRLLYSNIIQSYTSTEG